MMIMQSVSPFSSSDYWLAILSILIGAMFVTYQFVSWIKWERIRDLNIWWNKHVWNRHKEPYHGPSESMRELSHIYGVFIFILGLGLIAFGIMIFVVSIIGTT
jgi:hypothetical protein